MEAETVKVPEFPELREPVIRIGLKMDAKSVVFSANGHLYFNEGAHFAGTKSKMTAALSFVPQIAARYFVQAGSFSSRENANEALGILKSKTIRPGAVYENPDRRQFQLRLGPFSDIEKAQQTIDEIKTKGYPDAFYIAEDSAPGATLPDMNLLDELGKLILKTQKPVRIWTDDLILSIDQVAYRGYVTVFVNHTGRLTIVNALNFEDYLKGVVPNEIGPASAGTYEALKAQAVAARTYAYKNLKQFDSEGYDLCASARCQVYSGMNTENTLTSQAVEKTIGEVITYQEEPINALYTSTCGGYTENAEIMFEGWNYPYLRSVECYPEEVESFSRPAQIQGKAQPWWLSWLMAKTARVFAGSLDDPVDSKEVDESLSAVLQYLGKTPCSLENLMLQDWISVGSYLVNRLCWTARRDSLLNQKDYQYFISHLNFTLDRSPEANSFLLLFQEGILMPENLSGFSPFLPMSRSDFLRALFRILDHYHQIQPGKGLIREAKETEIQIVDDHGVHTYLLQNPVFLYQKVGETPVPKDRIVCSPGDKVEFLLEDGKIRILVCELSQTGVAADHSSKYSFWQETFTPEELGQKVSKYLDVGEVIDLQPLGYGASKRLSELKVTGSKNSGILKGIRIRWGLGLKDNLFVIDRTYDQAGKVKQFVFTGRGWGHGLGMCQIGAIGYAEQGKDYRSILQHYYTGVEITKLY